MKRGYFGIGIYNWKIGINVGTLWRSANLLGANFIFTIGREYKHQCSDTLKTFKHIPLFSFDTIDDLIKYLPRDCPLIGIELTDEAKDISKFSHPERACYLLGAEDHGIPEKVLSKCHETVKLVGEYSLNVSVAGSIIMYHRILQRE